MAPGVLIIVMNNILLSAFDGGCTDTQYVNVILHY
jgi:hypothetical protein